MYSLMYEVKCSAMRAGERARDAAICRALGASAGQLFRPILTESLLIRADRRSRRVLLAYAGGCAGPGDYGADRHSTARRSARQRDHSDLRVLPVGWQRLVLRTVAGHPSHQRETPPAPFGRARRSATEGRGRQRSREWLVGLEVALSTVLLVLAALLGVSFFRVTNVDLGYRVDRILTADVALPRERAIKATSSARNFTNGRLKSSRRCPACKQRD